MGEVIVSWEGFEKEREEVTNAARLIIEYSEHHRYQFLVTNEHLALHRDLSRIIQRLVREHNLGVDMIGAVWRPILNPSSQSIELSEKLAQKEYERAMCSKMEELQIEN